ncbi:aldo/keto reductase [Paenibacillus radicis (ex Gao et al. 2016)]|uniref:General stress protein 69 n=1 Tax=Paenibacillus radicis (ex Gao et al. 2016) TaxID=1737354 RepID=A0A917HCB8_9BACL|nr:aldo/keto reductase [Paenibacillus radicis (ex Gao et al. 2016)]GGG73957.1 general stress protein 69 [Paenibacillus radicis (ex Gao et al. 2016)]
MDVKQRTIGSSGMKASVIGLRAWAAGKSGWSETQEKEFIDVVGRAVELGVNFYDTAPTYSFGESERVLGKALKPVRDKVIVATKLGLVWNEQRELRIDLSRKSIFQEVEDSLRRLDTDYIDLYQVHWPDPKGGTPVEETFTALNDLVASGKIRHIGVSNFSVHQLVAAQTYAPIVSLQSPFNLFQRQVEYAELPYSEQRQVGFIPSSPLAQGQLTESFKANRSFINTEDHPPSNLKRDRYDDNGQKVELLSGIAWSIGKPISQLAINWLLHHKAIPTVLTGAKTIAQMEDNAAAAEWQLSEDDVKQVSRLFEPDSSYVI